MPAAASPKPKARLRLTDGQRGALWPMLAEAWLVHATAQGLRVSDSVAKEAWRHHYLGTTVGIWSLKQIPPVGPVFARVMGKLQEVARNGIEWIVKAGDVAPSDLVYHARAVLAEHDIPESYACGVARNACRLEEVPALEALEPAQLVQVIRIVHAQGPRISAAAKKSEAQLPKEEVPF